MRSYRLTISNTMKNSLFEFMRILLLFFLASLIGVLGAGTLMAQDQADPPEGPAPGVDAVEIQRDSLILPEEGEEEEDELIRPSHPPIEEIQPMPMPDDSESAASSKSSGPGQGVLHNPLTGETVTVPVDHESLSSGQFAFGGGYAGPNESFADEELPAMMSVDMYQIFGVGNSPWRMNAKLVMRFGTDWYVCSGTMRDAETILTAGHCVYDYGGYGWADEIWVYPGYDGTDWGLPPPSSVGSYGWGHGTYFGSWTGWTGSGDLNYDVGIIGVTRAVGSLTGWFGYAYGGDCSWHTSTQYNNASYPAEYCGGDLHNGLDMYYWYGYFDSCPSWNRLQIDTTGGCFNAIWGGMSGSGAYYIDGGNRYVHGICSTSDRVSYGRYARQFEAWVNWTNDTFIPTVRGTAFDVQALDVNAEPSTIIAGSSTTLLNHFATNPTNGAANGTWTFSVYLSTNDNISTADTLLSTQNYSWNFVAMGTVRVNMVQVTIPSDTAEGDYWLGVIYDCATDADCGNNDTDTWDAVPIHVTALTLPDLIVQSISTNPASPDAGENVDVTVTVRNQGDAAAGSFYVDFYKHLTSPPAPSQVGDMACYISSLSAGSTTTCNGTVVYDTAGTYSMYAQADTDQDVDESNEGNNVLGPQTIVVQDTQPDVSVSLTPDSTSVPRGGTLGYSVTVINNTKLSQTFQYWTKVDVPSGPTLSLLGPITVSLGPGASRSAHLSHAIPKTAPLGTYVYHAYVGPHPSVWDEDAFKFTVTSVQTSDGPRNWKTTIDQGF